MSRTYIKQKIKLVAEKVLHGQLKVTSAAEVVRYSYGTILGTLDYIDYAIPLFGYAKEVKQDPSDIYAQLEKALVAEIPCSTEYVNGYMNILVDNKYLKKVLLSQGETKKTEAVRSTDDKQVAIICSWDNSAAKTAAKLIHECVIHSGASGSALNPFPKSQVPSTRYTLKSDDDLRHTLNTLPGVFSDGESNAIYLRTGDETHALCSVKGAWYALAFILATTKREIQNGNKVFILGLSEVNQILRGIFPDARTLDVDVHAKHLNETYNMPIKELINASNNKFTAGNIDNLDVRQRQELIYVLDFDYEIKEALELGDLKRVLGEVTGLMR